MFGSFFNNSHCPIGIDLGCCGIRMLQLMRRGDRLAVGAAGTAYFPEQMAVDAATKSAAIVDQIKKLLDQGGFVGRKVVSCVPAALVQYKNIRLPKMSSEELRSAVEWEAKDRMSVPAGATIQYYDVGEVRVGEDVRQEIILMAAPLPVVEGQVDLLVRAGLRPIAIDAVPSALARSLGGGSGQAVTRVILDVGFETSKIAIVRGDHVLFFKIIELGGKKFNEVVANRLKITASEAAEVRRRIHTQADTHIALSSGDSAKEIGDQKVFEALRPIAGELARELGLCIRYCCVTYREARPQVVLLSGGEAYDVDLAQILAVDAGISVERAQPLKGFDLTRAPVLAACKTPLSEWSVATGLSLRVSETQALQGAA